MAIGLAINKNPAIKNEPEERVPDEKDTKKILGLFNRKQKIVNNDVEKLLDVSDAVATRYLSRLEEHGGITQHGQGKGTFYTKNT